MHRSSLLKNLLFAIAGFWIMHTMSSCGNAKQLMLLQGPFDTAKLSIIPPVEPIIRKGDILSIIVFSDNPEATKIYNQSLITTASSAVITTPGIAQAIGGAAPSGAGYQVDLDGNIVF